MSRTKEEIIQQTTDTEIDIIILWVDGKDPKWLAERDQYITTNNKANQSGSANRFRDWGLLRYLFRSIDQNMAWVNKIHLVTWGHIPKWLNTKSPKIHVVKHEDFIPKEFLPTFNTNVIHYYLNRIPGLANRFIVFDDDIYVLKPVSMNDFFVGDKIREEYAETVNFVPKKNDVYPHEMLNNVSCINQNYDKRLFYRKNHLKALSPKYGLKNLYGTLALQRWPFFGGFYSAHICQPYTKELYEKFWELGRERIDNTSKNRFRSNDDYTIHLVRFIAFMEGKFVPRNHRFGKRFELCNDNSEIIQALTKRKYSIVCLNDSDDSIDFDRVSAELQRVFKQLFPRRCDYEK